MSELKIHTGDLLLSEPHMSDPNFERTVVLVCSDDDGGHVGFVLNKPIKSVSLSDVLDGIDVDGFELYMGGPVEQNLLQFIHSYGPELEGSLKIAEGLYWGGNFDQLKGLMAANAIPKDSIRFFVGYSGWGEGQLSDEMKEHSWILAKDKTQLVFDQPDQLWKRILKSMGGKYRLMANYPIDPRLN